MAKYLCIVPCWHGLHRYRLGDIAEFEEGQWPKKIKKDKQGRVLEEKMIHFRALDPVEPIPVVEESPVLVNNKTQGIK